MATRGRDRECWGQVMATREGEGDRECWGQVMATRGGGVIDSAGGR